MRTLLAAVVIAAAVPAPSAPAATVPATVVVHIRDDAFVPASISVRPGTPVTFVNDDDDAHTVTADDRAWDSEGLNLGQRWTHAFTRTGDVRYHCTVHPMMRGTIRVRGGK